MIGISQEDIQAIIAAMSKGGRDLAIKEIKKRMPNINDVKAAHAMLSTILLSIIPEPRWMM